MKNEEEKKDSSKTVFEEEELEDEKSANDGSYTPLGKSANDVSGGALISESVRETITEAGKSLNPTSRIGLGNDFSDNVFGAAAAAQDDFGGDSLPLGTVGQIGAGRTPAAGGISPLKVTAKASLGPPRGDRPPSAASKYSAVVFSQPVIPPPKEKSNHSDEEGSDYEDDFEDDFEPYETSNEEEAQAEANTTPNNPPPPEVQRSNQTAAVTDSPGNQNIVNLNVNRGNDTSNSPNQR